MAGNEYAIAYARARVREYEKGIALMESQTSSRESREVQEKWLVKARATIAEDRAIVAAG